VTSRHPPITDETLETEALDALNEAIAPLAPPPGLRDKVLARVRGAASELITVRGGKNGWKELAPGIAFKMLTYDVPSGIKSFLLRAAPGVRMPAHGHSGFEECLVLEGEFTLGDLTLRAGDFHAVTERVQHGEAATETGTLVYLRASIHDYPGIGP
jgi:putative transcriptional regulator